MKNHEGYSDPTAWGAITNVQSGKASKNDARTYVYQLRLNDEEVHMLDYICGATGTSKAEALRMSLRLATLAF